MGFLLYLFDSILKVKNAGRDASRTCFAYPNVKLLAVKWFAPLVLFNDHEVELLDFRS
jgi:hypothetical protein